MTPLKTGNITAHFSWAESVVTEHRDIDNFPSNDTALLNIPKTAANMELVRQFLEDKYISVNSWYRCPQLNTAIGSKDTSDHILGAAVDFTSGFGTPVEVCKRLIQYGTQLRFKQLILEHTWVHISWEYPTPAIPRPIPKMQVLSLLSTGGYATGLTDRNGIPFK